MKKKILFIIIIVLVLISSRFAVSMFSSYMKQKARSNYVPPLVSVEEVKQEKVIQSFEAPGRVVSKYQVSIMARVSGYLQKSYFKVVYCFKSEEALVLIQREEDRYATNSAGANIGRIKDE